MGYCFWKNKEWSLNSQLQLSTGLLACVSEIVALIVLIALTFSMCHESKMMAKNSLEEQIFGNIEVAAYQTSLVIDRSLTIVVDSVMLAINRGLEFSEEYDINSHLNGEATLWEDEIPSASDYQTQMGRLGEVDISFVADSMYLIEVKDDSIAPGFTWTVHDSNFNDPGNPARIQEFFDGSSHLTRLMAFSYEQWPSIASIYIGSDFGKFACPFGYSQSTCENGNYIYHDSHYRTFRNYPGRKTSNSIIQFPGTTIQVPYDPTLRGWYIGANTTTYNYHLDGPYTDATSGKWMITFAKKAKETATSPRSVIGIDVLLTDLTNLVSSLSIGTNGFAILLLYPRAAITTCAQDGATCDCETGLVRYGNSLAWSDWRRHVGTSIQCVNENFGVYTTGPNRICQCEPVPFVLAYGSSAITEEKKLSDIDPDLLASNFTLSQANSEKGSFSYTKSGETYVGGFGKALEGSMVVITVVPEAEVLASVDVLENDISKTEASITTIVILCTLAALIVSVIIVYKSSRNISQPLVDISENCNIVMGAQTKEDKIFEPRPITVFGFDSLYELAREFVKLMKGMHETEERKQAEPKYPANDHWVGLDNMQAPWRIHPIQRYHNQL